MDGERAGIDDPGGPIPQRLQLLAFMTDGIEQQGLGGCRRMQAAGLTVAPLEHFGGGFEKDDLEPVAGLLQRPKDPIVVIEKLPFANVNPQRYPGNIRHIPFTQGQKFRKQRHRQVVNTEVMKILEGFDGGTLARARQAGHHHHVNISLRHGPYS